MAALRRLLDSGVPVDARDGGRRTALLVEQDVRVLLGDIVAPRRHHADHVTRERLAPDEAFAAGVRPPGAAVRGRFSGRRPAAGYHDNPDNHSGNKGCHESRSE